MFFTVHYLMLRGFYALEQNRTVFYIQCVIAATNIVVALLLVSRATPADTSPALVAGLPRVVPRSAPSLSYLLLRPGSAGCETAELVRFLVRLVIAATISTAVAWGLGQVLPGGGHDVSHVMAGVRLVLLGTVDVAVFVLLARLMRLREVTIVVDTVVQRFSGARHS